MNKKIINYLFIFVQVLGLGGFLIVSYFPSKLLIFSPELPVSDVRNIVVDHSENIYLALGDLGYIQKYSKTGDFLSNWKIKYRSSSFFTMDIEEEVLRVKSDRGHQLELFDFEGTEVSHFDQDVSHINIYESNSFRLTDGTQYIFVEKLNNEIIKVDKDGKRSLIKQFSIYHAFIGSKFKCLALMAFGALGLFIMSRLKRK